jgi:Flp pilus assembly protein TadD
MEEAQRACHQALVLNPNSPEAHLEAGKIEARRGRTDLAARHFSEALRLKPDDEEARQAMNELQGSGATTK